jgi:hypothetical protein
MQNHFDRTESIEARAIYARAIYVGSRLATSTLDKKFCFPVDKYSDPFQTGRLFAGGRE